MAPRIGENATVTWSEPMLKTLGTTLESEVENDSKLLSAEVNVDAPSPSAVTESL